MKKTLIICFVAALFIGTMFAGASVVKTETVDIQSDQFMVIDKSEKDITNRGVTSSMSDKDKLQKFMEIKEISPDKQVQYLKRGLEIIDSCEEE